MKTRAAIAWKAGAPLTVEEVELEGPKAGEVLLYQDERQPMGSLMEDRLALQGQALHG